MQQKWPILSYEKAKNTYETLHMWTQIVGKIKLETLPWVNHSWHITLHVTPLGLTTQMMPFKNLNFQIDFDFIEHRLKIATSLGENRQFDLHNISVADFYKKIFELLKELDIEVEINPNPCEVEHPIPLDEDNTHANYNEEQVKAFHQALIQMQNVFFQFRSGFKGKSSAVHFFWGSFDLALSFFSGRKAPKHPGGVPGMPNWVAEEAYCREVSSCGFWPGSDALPEASFYCYHYPAPEGYGKANSKPEKAFFHEKLGEFILPYSAVQKAENPAETLREFLNSTYGIGADLANWDREILERTDIQ